MTDQQTNGAAAEDNSPQFSLQRIYVRDLSFEAPKSRRSSASSGSQAFPWT